MHSSSSKLAMRWGEIAYVDSGSTAQPLLLLHGTGCDASDWTPVVERLPRERRYITFDFRGHGQSTVPLKPFTLSDLADDVLYLINALKIQKLQGVGHSLGGMVAMEIAKRSSRVTGLVLLEGWTSLSAASSAFEDHLLYGSLPETTVTRIQQKANETRNRFHPNIWHDFWESVKNFDAYNYLQQADIRICEVYGSSGKNALTEQKLRIPSNPNIHWVWIPNVGHYLPHECPVEVATVVNTFAVT